MSWEVIEGDCLDVMRSMPDNSVDSVVTDPPAGISFMSREWDSDRGGRDAWIAWLSEVLAECNRVMKPGAHALVWAIPRTSHWTGMAIENAGLNVRDVVTHLFGSGFPKSLSVDKAIDKMAGAEREVIGTTRSGLSMNDRLNDDGWTRISDTEAAKHINVTAPATPEAEQWQGWGTALKPSAEFWFLARKPLAEKSIAANVLAHGTGALNVDGCRVEATDKDQYEKNNAPWYQWQRKNSVLEESKGMNTPGRIVPGKETPAGRWPPNTLLSTSAAAALDAQSGILRNGGQNATSSDVTGMFGKRTPPKGGTKYSNDTGGASRFFPVFEPEYDVPWLYCAKASRRERNAGLEGLPEAYSERDNGFSSKLSDTKIARANHHPTVKSVRLMEWLVRLVTPPSGTCLDPFCGSGSTGVASVNEGFSFIGIEREAEYVEIARLRIEHAVKQVKQLELVTE